MDTSGADAARDDSTWPRGALTASLLIGVVGLGAGIAFALRQADPLVPLLFVFAGLLAGSSLLAFGFRRWLRGEKFPNGLTLVTVVCIVVIIILAGVSGVHPLYGLGGLGAGCMLANVWAIRAARANRPHRMSS
ncbi:hypothetical protein AB0B31_34990 [Catellatospora citrea]|uniref:hypothetical protein n=1 Tax=Catellatospora citrea TaxID=53366 RepID=UPI003408A30B